MFNGNKYGLFVKILVIVSIFSSGVLLSEPTKTFILWIFSSKTIENVQEISPLSALPSKKVYKVSKGDVLGKVIINMGVSPKKAYEILHLMNKMYPVKKVKPGQIIELDFDEKDNFISIIWKISEIQSFKIFVNSTGNLEKEDTSRTLIPQTKIVKTATAAKEFSLLKSFPVELKNIESFIYTANVDPENGKEYSKDLIWLKGKDKNGKEVELYKIKENNGGFCFVDREGKTFGKLRACFPLTSIRKSRGYGVLKHPILGYHRFHGGNDYVSTTGSKVLAVLSGKVVKNCYNSGYGKHIIINHGKGYMTLYAHLSKTNVKEGSHVEKGQIIGSVGSSGLATGPHLHFEVRINNQRANPDVFFRDFSQKKAEHPNFRRYKETVRKVLTLR